MSKGMVVVVRWLVRLYELALRLYPEGIRKEYFHEMQAVFRLKAANAAQQGVLSLVHFICREARDLPGAIVRNHLKARKAKMRLPAGDYVHGGPLNAWKIAAVFLPFGLTLLLSVGDILHGTLFAAAAVTLFVLLVVVWIAGLAAAFPVWALTSLGMLLYFFYFYVFKLFTQTVLFLAVMLPLFGGWPKDLALGIVTLLLIAIATSMTMAGVLLVLLLLLPKLRGRIREDWTFLSFLLYGMAIMPMFMLDEYHHLWGYQFTGLLVLALGAGLYLKAPGRWQQILALVVPVVLTQVLEILGLYQTYPLEAWIDLNNPTQRIWEALQPLSDPLPILLFLPVFVSLLPNGGKPAQASAGDSTLLAENRDQ